MASLPLPPTLECPTLLMPRGFLGLEPIQLMGNQAVPTGPRSDMILPGILRDNRFCGSDSLSKEERCYRNLVILFRLLYRNKTIPESDTYWKFIKEGWGLGVAMNCTPAHVRDITLCYHSARLRWIRQHGRAFTSLLTRLVDCYNDRAKSNQPVSNPASHLVQNQAKWNKLLSNHLFMLLNESKAPEAFSNRAVNRMIQNPSAKQPAKPKQSGKKGAKKAGPQAKTNNTNEAGVVELKYDAILGSLKTIPPASQPVPSHNTAIRPTCPQQLGSKKATNWNSQIRGQKRRSSNQHKGEKRLKLGESGGRVVNVGRALNNPCETLKIESSPQAAQPLGLNALRKHRPEERRWQDSSTDSYTHMRDTERILTRMRDFTTSTEDDEDVVLEPAQGHRHVATRSQTHGAISSFSELLKAFDERIENLEQRLNIEMMWLSRSVETNLYYAMQDVKELVQQDYSGHHG